MSAEFSIWGVPPGDDAETLLCEAVRGERITERALAEAVKAEAERRGNTRVRILELDLSKPFDFAAMALGKGN